MVCRGHERFCDSGEIRRVKAGKIAEEAANKKLGRFTTDFTNGEEKVPVENTIDLDENFLVCHTTNFVLSLFSMLNLIK